ncbi:MAG: DUF262 domain-containing protein [Prevotella sp.]|nr:DUF262 domain-containing protein [Prevotella sp.]
MSENRIEMKSVQELLPMKFFIPDYQRGYRWTKQQVKDLLEDISDFSNKDTKSGEFYCLQPLVVREMTEDEKENSNLSGNETWYEVIDGQQRLTTIYLILTALSEVIEILGLPTDIYQLRYQRYADRDDNFLDTIKNLKQVDSSQIDCYHMSDAYLYIQQWLKDSKVNKADFCNTLLKHKPKANIPSEDEANNVRFIWYESVDENPIKVFTRLNIGKISLTNAELIKALLLNRGNFQHDMGASVKLRQQEIASEWDNIEYTLQKEAFWLFLHDTGYSHPTRIDFIFNLVCEQNQLHLNDSQMSVIGNDEYRTFRYFNEYFKQQEHDIYYCWRAVKSYHQTFMEWYDDLQLYHYIGYLIAEKKGIQELIGKWNELGDKVSFVHYLKSEIKAIISKSTTKDFQYKNKRKCKPILLFHNIQTVINQNQNELNNKKYQVGTFYKFPFHLYKLEKWDVEHINSSAENPENDANTQAEWLMNVYWGVSDDVQGKIKGYFDAPEEKRQELFNSIKDCVSIPDTWPEDDKDKLWNYTLLDAATNRSYGNAIFSAKRRIIIGKDKGMLIPVPKLSRDKKQMVLGEESKSTSSFVPPCTKQVFMKYYSPMAGDNNYWTRAIDAEAYMSDIENCIKQLEEK